jgi:hypothetical protein
MTRQERLEQLALNAGEGVFWGARVADGTNVASLASKAGHYGNAALDHLAALEQQAITAYLADVPLPEGWTERPDQWGGTFYADETGVERVLATERRVDAIRKPRHWPAIPLPVLIRAAVQCHRLREAAK